MRGVLFIPIFLIFLPPLPAGELVSKVYTLGSSDLKEVQDTVRPLLSEKGKMVLLPVERKMLVQDVAANMETVDAVMTELTAPRPNVKVEILFNESTSQNRSEGGVRWKNGGPVTVNLSDRRSTRESSSGQFLVVQSGREASIRVVEEVPFVDFFYTYALNRGYINADVHWRSIGTQMSVRPRVSGNLIEVEVVPQITRLVDGKCEVIECRELATTVTVGNGMEVSLGGFKGASDEFNRNFFTAGNSGSAGGGGFRLRAGILESNPVVDGQ